MEGAQPPGSVGDALQDQVRIPQPGDEDFDPTAPQPGEDGYEEWLAAQATPPLRPSERIDAGGPMRADEAAEPLARDPRAALQEQDQRPILGFLVEPRLAHALLAYLGQMPHDEVRPLVDGLQASPAIPAESAEDSAVH